MDEQAKTVADFEKRIEDIKRDHNGILAKVREEHAESEKAMIAKHENEIAMLKAALGQSAADELQRLKLLHAEEIKKLTEKHEKHIADLN